MAGEEGSTFAVARYDADGTLDTTFGTNGWVTTVIQSEQSSARANAVAIQPDGKIVAVGYVRLNHQNDFAMVRYNPDGSLDTSFSGDGRAHNDFDGKDDEAKAVAIQSDGRIVVAGMATDVVDFLPDDEDFGVERLMPNGTLDTSFSGNGKTLIGFGGNDRVNAMVLQPDGKIVVAGTSWDSLPSLEVGNFAVARLNTNGSLDSSFSDDGQSTADLGDDDEVQAIALAPDGKIVLVGYLYGDPKFGLARYNPNRTLVHLGLNQPGITPPRACLDRSI